MVAGPLALVAVSGALLFHGADVVERALAAGGQWMVMLNVAGESVTLGKTLLTESATVTVNVYELPAALEEGVPESTPRAWSNAMPGGSAPVWTAQFL